MESKLLSNEDVILLIEQRFPEFFVSHAMKQIKEYMNEADLNIGIKIIAFGRYVLEEYENKSQKQIQEIFDFVEDMLIRGNEEVQNAFATCFLESMINQVPTLIPLETFVQLLGPESKAYCKAWNDFCGIQMEGI